MKNLLLVICVTLALGTVASMPSYAQVISRNAVGFEVDGKPSGIFCNVDKAEVCVLTRNEEDCTKLSGAKVDACPATEKEEAD